MEKEVKKRIQTELAKIEEQFGVKIIYACESGSRAWGFASQDSDYDVRFLYLHPTDWYLTIRNKRDVIELPITDELDISGWDIRKTLQLLRKSNPALLEWMQSPIVYRQDDELFDLIKKLIPEFYSPIGCLYHYLNMAKDNRKTHLEGSKVWLKKYLYVLRPVLACMWIEQDRGPAPTEFHKLVDAIVLDNKLREGIDKLLKHKMAGKESDKGPKIPVISEFIDEQIERLESVHAEPSNTRDPETMDQTFRNILDITEQKSNLNT